MATTSTSFRPVTLQPERIDRFLAVAAVLLLAAVLLAIFRGYAEWGRVPPVIWLHIGTVLAGVGLTPVMLLRRRGDPTHRALGWVWSAALFLTALVSMFIRVTYPGHFSIIHVLSVFTMVQVPIIVGSARAHNVARHRRAVRGMVIGALLIAGFFTFTSGRLLEHWLFDSQEKDRTLPSGPFYLKRP